MRLPSISDDDDVDDGEEFAVLGEVMEVDMCETGGDSDFGVWLGMNGSHIGSPTTDVSDRDDMPVDFQQMASEFLLPDEGDGNVESLVLG